MTPALGDVVLPELPLLDELALIAALSVAVTVLLARLRIPTVAGLLVAGALVGPHGLRWVSSTKEIELLAELGVVFLLFSIGLELGVSRLRDVLQQVALGGALQVGLTLAAVALGALALGESLPRAVFYGFVFALSSTAIVLRALSERREVDAPHGRVIVGTLLFQDLCVVPMVLIVPLLAAPDDPATAVTSLGLALGKAILVVGVVLVGAGSVLPAILLRVDASRSREVFLLAILALCIGTAWLTALAGLSLALGAFLAGMLVADTEFGHRALSDILPLRDAFVSLFFVSLGMLFEPAAIPGQPVAFALFLGGFLGLKMLVATASALFIRFPARVAWLAGVGLAQFGEFGFVLAKIGEQSGLVTSHELAPLLSAGIVSMFLTPLMVRVAPHVAAGERLLAPLERLLGVRSIDEADGGGMMADHVVVVGFGLAGQAAARALAASGVPIVVLDLDARNVRRGRELGLPVFYGDATSAEALGHAHLASARLLVLLMNDPSAVERVLDCARRVAPAVPVVVRSRYLLEREGLLGLGATDVVVEEVEGAAEVVTRLLRWLGAPRGQIAEALRLLRATTGTDERRIHVPALRDHRALDDIRVEAVEVHPASGAAGSSLAALGLQARTGALVVGLRRDGTLLHPVDPALPLVPRDVVYLAGPAPALERALPDFAPPAPHVGQGGAADSSHAAATIA